MSQAVDASSLQDTPASQPLTLDRALEYITLAVLVLSVIVYVSAFVLGFTWIQRPFLGAFVEQKMIFNQVGDNSPLWDTHGKIPLNSQLVAMDGIPTTSWTELNAVLAERRAGQTVTVTVREPNGVNSDYAVALRNFPLGEITRYFLVPYVVGLVYMAVGLWVFRFRRKEAAGRAFALMCALAAIGVGGLFDMYTTHYLTWAWSLSLPNVAAALMALALVFPEMADFVRKQPALRLLPFVPGLLISFITLYFLYAPDAAPTSHFTPWLWSYYYIGIGLIFFIGMVLYRWRFAKSPTARQQALWISVGALAGFGSLLSWVLLIAAGFNFAIDPLLNLAPLVFFPLAVAFAILRYRVLDMDKTVAQALVYALVGVITLVGYSMIILGIVLITGQAFQQETVANVASSPLALGLLVFALVALFNPLQERLRAWVDKAFFRGSRSYTRQLEAFGSTLNQASGLTEITNALSRSIEDVIRPAHTHIFLHDATNDEFIAMPDASGRPSTDIRFAGDGPLARHLGTERSSLYLSPDVPLNPRLARDRARLAVLSSALYVPLLGKNRLAGWLAIGPRLSGDPFSSDDLRFLESLSDQTALAIERASVINDLERRVRELNVVSQMSQAVSVTVAYDDLLELINGQASKIVDARNYYLMLKDQRKVLRYTLVVENDERLSEQENKPVPAERGLEPEILRTGQPIRVDDYTEECHRRGVVPGAKLYRAWMGVPLNTGSETIGVMVVASTDPAVFYTEDQLKVFWTIADQAASALVKARLFQQSEQRAKQLATLNDVSLTIASTLELDPLLQKIVQSAVTILNCEAGSLFLVDTDTGENVFRVAVGPVGQNLVGMRIPAGRGVVGEVIDTGLPIIINDAANDPRIYKATDNATGFFTRAVMTVPMRFQGKAVGALQLLNKRDGSPFDEEDQNLLIAFATPSVIAIENARLFTQTDQALASRVEELSIMQRIGRELNNTLDLGKVADITLEWACRNSGADAGWLGLVGETGISIVSVDGYGEKTERLVQELMPLDADVPGLVIRSGEYHYAPRVIADHHYLALRDETQSQLTVPIKREGRVIGLLALDANAEDAFTEEEIGFVGRLTDLAAIALTNSSLYKEVNAANTAKSEFVSFVAHELKTPMTSIKGYADLVGGGAVGPVNDMQKQFIGTIRSNVERMNTLVSDLSDIARIESGRLKLESRALQFAEVIDEVSRTMKGLIDGKKQTLEIQAEGELPAVFADRVRVAQVLTNLVSNAYKYTPENGHILLRAEKAPNPRPEGPPGEVLHISVKDTGVGISPEDQKKLFTKFFRADDRMAREMATGTGLGLNIVKNLVEMQGGQIWFESEFRKGSTFHFTLPLAEAVATPSAN